MLDLLQLASFIVALSSVNQKYGQKDHIEVW